MVIDKNTWIPIVESFKKWKASFGWMKSRLLPLKSLARWKQRKKWSATTRPSLVHKQSIRVVSATAIWPTSDLGPRIDRPPFVIPLRDILSFLVECRVILCGKGAEPGTSFTGYLRRFSCMSLSVQNLPEENHLHHSPPTKHVTGFGNSNASEAIFITVRPIKYNCSLPYLEIEYYY